MKKSAKVFVESFCGNFTAVLTLYSGYRFVKWLEWRKQIKQEEKESQERVDAWMAAKKG